jgi:hypothetical protein
VIDAVTLGVSVTLGVRVWLSVRVIDCERVWVWLPLRVAVCDGVEEGLGPATVTLSTRYV